MGSISDGHVWNEPNNYGKTIDDCKAKFDEPNHGGKEPAFTGFETKDSGSRRSFSTGSVRDAATGKGRYDLVSPLALERLAQLYERGAAKYDARNWEKDQPLSAYMDCAMRHLNKHLAGLRDEDHLAAAAWNIFGMIHTEICMDRGLLPVELDDLPDYTDETGCCLPLLPQEAEEVEPAPVEQFTVEVQLPVGIANETWTPFRTRDSLEKALLALEHARRGKLAQRVFLIRRTCGKVSEIVRMVWPGDAPVVEFAELPPCADA